MSDSPNPLADLRSALETTPDTALTVARCVEAAEGPDRELDAQLWWRHRPRESGICFSNGALGLPRQLDHEKPIPDGLGGVAVRAMSPRYTASLDDALALLTSKLPGWAWSVGNRRVGAQAYLMCRPGAEMIGGKAPTPALALLLALIRALESEHD